jgi:hypothetical protein
MNATDNRFEELLALLTGIAARQLSPHEITQIWPERHRILFTTTDGRAGDVEVFVNWDVAQKTKDSI